MRSIRRIISIALVVALAGVGLTVTTTTQAQRRAYRMTDQQVDQIIRRIETRTDRFRLGLDRALDRTRIDGTRREDNINAFVRDFETATDQLRNDFNTRRSTTAGVEAV